MTALTIETPPTLGIDQWFADFDAGIRYQLGNKPTDLPVAPIKLNSHQKGERRVLWNLLKHLERAGWAVYYVYDGEERTSVWPGNDPHKTTMELVFNLDEAWIRFIPRRLASDGFSRSERVIASHGVYIVRGNEPEELVCDYTFAEGDADDFVVAMETFNAEDYI